MLVLGGKICFELLKTLPEEVDSAPAHGEVNQKRPMDE
jgi:hypothetical protein